MIFRFKGKKISSLLTVVPPHETKFEDEIDNFNFSREKSMKLKKVMGFDRHRLVEDDVCASDLCLFAVRSLMESGAINAEEVGALVFVSQSPDHFIPPTSNILQGKLGLGKDVFCLDINQGCAGFVVGLMQAFMLLELGRIKKVLLLNADTLSRKVGKHDRNIYPMIGDAASVTVVEHDPEGAEIVGFLQMDGSRSSSLMIPAGGFRSPCTAETAVERDLGDGNLRSDEQFYMDGPSVFNFVQTEVPPMIREVTSAAGLTLEDIDFFLTHQPNKFMLEKLCSTLGVPPAKMPNNVVENFGNASSVTIPTNIAFNLASTVKNGSVKVCMSGFGVGLTLASLVMDLGPMAHCSLVDYDRSGTVLKDLEV